LVVHWELAAAAVPCSLGIASPSDPAHHSGNILSPWAGANYPP
jgi:hypothetical protein